MLRTPLSSDSMWDLLSCPTHSSCPKVAQATVSEMLPPGTPVSPPPRLGPSTALPSPRPPRCSRRGGPDVAVPTFLLARESVAGFSS